MAPDLTRLVEAARDRWSLTIEGEPTSPVVPVRRFDGTAAVLVVGATEAEAAALSAWGGRGAALLLAHDAGASTALVERLGRSLHDEPSAEEAVEHAAALLPLLHGAEVPDGLATHEDEVPLWVEILDGARSGPRRPVPKRRVEEALELAVALPADGVPSCLLHGDLAVAHVRRGLGRREDEWLAFAPAPLAGDPASEALPLLCSRTEGWDEIEAPEREVEARLARICGAGALDPDRARAWALLLGTLAHVRAVVEGPADDVPLLDLVGRALASPPVL